MEDRWSPGGSMDGLPDLELDAPAGRVQLESGSITYSRPRFLQAVAAFEGAGFDQIVPLADGLCYTVPAGQRAQLIYFRAGNSADELICLVLLRDDSPLRYFPVGARASVHISLAVVEDLLPGTTLEVHVAAPEGTSGTAIVDVGLLEG